MLVVNPFIVYCYGVYQEQVISETPAVPHTQDERVCLDHLSLTLQPDVTFFSVDGRQLRNQIGGVKTHGEIVEWRLGWWRLSP